MKNIRLETLYIYIYTFVCVLCYLLRIMNNGCFIISSHLINEETFLLHSYLNACKHIGFLRSVSKR
uniref:Uncharacterized protein n=1 Tax=Octopus bimaculoides TaxID=37653 RepID=A0A0L8FZC2_OCTBM